MLTKLLKNALGGNSKTVMVSPHYKERNEGENRAAIIFFLFLSYRLQHSVQLTSITMKLFLLSDLVNNNLVSRTSLLLISFNTQKGPIKIRPILLQ